ncbi:hypothetical protein pdam_00020736 [Pocillopora damicornis]|uniref:Uncharacterized protein n=1 Tax=Pocillopora damicornis TaxID=46731 RepID=A0A3M6TW92_POCDA|nr:hypothetical protein pdam_00020736 [Pocillopora damicornis]
MLAFKTSVALAELPFENPSLDELSDEDREEITEELEEVENDPFFLEPPSGPPSPSPPPEKKYTGRPRLSGPRPSRRPRPRLSCQTRMEKLGIAP